MVQLAAKPDPHRPGIFPALGLRAGSDVVFILTQTRIQTETGANHVQYKTKDALADSEIIDGLTGTQHFTNGMLSFGLGVFSAQSDFFLSGQSSSSPLSLQKRTRPKDQQTVKWNVHQPAEISQVQGDLPNLVAEPVKGFELQTPISGQSKCLTHSATNENVDSKVGRPPR